MLLFLSAMLVASKFLAIAVLLGPLLVDVNQEHDAASDCNVASDYNATSNCDTTSDHNAASDCDTASDHDAASNCSVSTLCMALAL